MKKIVLLLTISILLAACGTNQQNTAPEIPEESNGTSGNNSSYDKSDLEETDKSEELKKDKEEQLKEKNTEELAGTLEYKDESFIFTVENNQGKDVEVVFSSGQEYDYMVYYADGKMVKKLSEGMMYTQAIREDILAPGETFTYSASFDEVASGLAEGDYTIEFIFSNKNFRASAKEAFNVE